MAAGGPGGSSTVCVSVSTGIVVSVSSMDTTNGLDRIPKGQPWPLPAPHTPSGCFGLAGSTGFRPLVAAVPCRRCPKLVGAEQTQPYVSPTSKQSHHLIMTFPIHTITAHWGCLGMAKNIHVIWYTPHVDDVCWPVDEPW